MAVITAQAKLYQGTYATVVDKILDLTNISSTSSISCNITRLVSFDAIIDAEVATSATPSLPTLGGRMVASLTSSLTCKFPTYVRIDVDKLMLPEGTDIILQLEEGFVYEGDYAESLHNPMAKNDNLISFRTPKRIYGQLIASNYSLSSTTGFRRYAGATMSSAVSLTSRITYNPGRFASLVVTNFANTTVAKKTVSPGSVMSSAFTFPIGNFKTRLFESNFVLDEATLTQPSENARVRFGVSTMTNSIVQQSQEEYYKGTAVELDNEIIFNSTAIKIIRPTLNLTAQSGLTCEVTKTTRISAAITATSSIETITDMRLIMQTDLNYTDALGNALTPSTTVMIPLGVAAETDSIYGATNLTIDWGDGQTTTITKLRTADESQLYHTYAQHGTYDIRVKMNSNTSYIDSGMGFYRNIGESGDGDAKPEWIYKIKEIKSWGIKSFKKTPTSDLWLGYLFANMPDNANFKLIDHLPPVSCDLRLDQMFSNSKINPSGLLTWNLNPTGYTYRAVVTTQMFEQNTNFNQPIGVWDVSKYQTTVPISMFANNTAFDQDLGNWYTNISASSSQLWFDGARLPGLSQENYNRSLIGWANRHATGLYPNFVRTVEKVNATRNTETNTVYGTGTYTTGIAAKAYLQSQGWIFTTI